ncbi:MAG: RHS repeat-associated core domain-containing protein, partial [Eubacterium sp.]|nr:RHS repeat-associated core domain-containing protein [Eubacterium sp.]
DDVTTVKETHFNTPFTTVISENNIKYTGQAYQLISEKISDTIPTVDGNKEIPVYKVVNKLVNREFNYNVQKNDDKVTETITGDLNRSLNSEQYFNEESNTYYKNYENSFSYYNTYDDNGNIIGDENNSYTYNEFGELISTSGLVNASYQYDSRGNITSKTVDGDTTTYSYDNVDWKDQLTSVNGIPLTYDANGNLASYGNSTYTWSHGKQLESVTNEKGTYRYTYDENGVRLTKPGYTFNTFNGRVLAQHGENNIYFQYNGDKPIGFILNQHQYYYITNPSGDIVGITDSKCDLIATYTYDEWGKLLEITADDDDNRQIAETNPLRYRGYYYDNETGYYYLQSRYYDPNLGRFISADDFSYVDTSHELNMNAYSYCWNSPIALEDAEGTTPQISIDLSALQPLVEGATTVIKAGLNKLAENIKKLISRYNDFLD